MRLRLGVTISRRRCELNFARRITRRQAMQIRTVLLSLRERGRILGLALASVATVVWGTCWGLPAAAATPGLVSFQNQVLPIFEKHCIACHSLGGVGVTASALDLTSYKDLRYGSVRGVALVPFHSDRSPIMLYLKDNWESKNPYALKMPPLGPRLSPEDLKLISDWIDQGAKNN
jgi:mono/diheme cytochrome c family protein